MSDHVWFESSGGTRTCQRQECGVVKVALDARGRWCGWSQAAKFEYQVRGRKKAQKSDPGCRGGP